MYYKAKIWSVCWKKSGGSFGVEWIGVFIWLLCSIHLIVIWRVFLFTVFHYHNPIDSIPLS